MSLPSVNIGSLLSAAGSNSGGIDVNSTVAQLIDVERARERQWQAQQNVLQTQAASINVIKNLVSTLTDKLNVLKDPVGAFTARTASSSQPNIVSATAGSGATSANHIVVVNNVATTGAWYSSPMASGTTPLAAGSFDLQVGSGPVTNIPVGSGVNTLNDLATNINGRNLGVSATVVNDANGARLALVSTNSGSAADFTISNATGLTFTRAVSGANASLTVDGIPINSASNTVTGVIAGVTFNLASAAPGTPVSVSITNDSSQVSKAVSDFVGAYNAVVSNVNSQFSFNQTTQTAGPLAGDSTIRMLQSSLLGIGGYSSSTSGSITTLGSLGISMNKDGTLTLDSAKLDSAIASNFASVQTFLQGTASDGFAANLVNGLNTFSSPTSGAFTVSLQSITNETSDLQDKIDEFEVFLTGETARLTAVYNQVDIILQQLPIIQKQIDAQLGYSGSK